MERAVGQFLAFGLIFVTINAHSAPAGISNEFRLQTKYSCQANGVVVRHQDRIISRGEGFGEVKFVAAAGRTQALTFGDHRDYMIWPRVNNRSFNKSLNVMVKEKSGNYKIIQEVDVGDAKKTRTMIGLTVREGKEEFPVNCKMELEWVKK